MTHCTTTLAAARRRCLEHLAPPGRSMRAAQFGFIGFPDAKFRSPQGAAFASALLRRQMADDRVITEDWESFGEHIITKKGLAELSAIVHNRTEGDC